MTQRTSDDIYIHTSNGHRYYPFSPDPAHLDIEVIAHHLACQSRWAGATQHRIFPERISYSVAEHSVYVMDYVIDVLGRPDLALTALLHDAAEAYIQDIIRPLKHSPTFGEPFKALEELNELVIAKRYGIIFPFPPEIKIADEAVCNAEFNQIVPKNAAYDWSEGVCHDSSQVADISIEMMLPYDAKCDFLIAHAHAMNLREIHHWVAANG